MANYGSPEIKYCRVFLNEKGITMLCYKNKDYEGYSEAILCQ